MQSNLRQNQGFNLLWILLDIVCICIFMYNSTYNSTIVVSMYNSKIPWQKQMKSTAGEYLCFTLLLKCIKFDVLRAVSWSLLQSRVGEVEQACERRSPTGASPKGGNPKIRYFVANAIFVVIYLLFERLSKNFQRKSPCFGRAHH